MAKGSDQPIIIKKKKGGGHGHHGGAWKVAFADFMTAMFTLFLVLWLTNQTTDVKEAVANYFRDPIGFTTGGSRALTPGLTGNPSKKSSASKQLTVRTSRTSVMMAQSALRSRLESYSREHNLGNSVSIEMMPEGLRISLTENPDVTFFQSGNAHMAPEADAVLRIIGQELAQLQNKIMIEGHTDSSPFGSKNYSNWELSTDRAHAARRILVGAGLPETQIEQVRGFADRDPAVPDDRMSSRNRRITITVLQNPVEDPLSAPAVPDEGAAHREPAEEEAPTKAPAAEEPHEADSHHAPGGH